MASPRLVSDRRHLQANLPVLQCLFHRDGIKDNSQLRLRLQCVFLMYVTWVHQPTLHLIRRQPGSTTNSCSKLTEPSAVTAHQGALVLGRAGGTGGLPSTKPPHTSIPRRKKQHHPHFLSTLRGGELCFVPRSLPCQDSNFISSERVRTPPLQG